MNTWKTVVKVDPIDWLLEEENPSVRYFTLRDILDLPQSRPEVKQAKAAIMKKGVVPLILAKQNEGGFWGVAEDFYIRAKYKGTVWTLLILAELAADGRDKRIKKACEFILQYSQDRQSGGFAYTGSAENGGHHSKVIPCLTGNMVWSLIRLGYLDDPRVQRGIDWITTHQRFDDKIDKPPKGWPYHITLGCWGMHTCSMGAIKALKALAEIPEQARSPEVKETLIKGAGYFLQHHVYKRSHNLEKVCKPGWLKFGFPLMYNTDALEILGILTRLGHRDRRMQEAVDLVISKQDDLGRWLLEHTYNGRFQVNIEQKGKSSKWVTLNALRALKRFYY